VVSVADDSLYFGSNALIVITGHNGQTGNFESRSRRNLDFETVSFTKALYQIFFFHRTFDLS
jgi:hypothetical protein